MSDKVIRFETSHSDPRKIVIMLDEFPVEAQDAIMAAVAALADWGRHLEPGNSRRQNAAWEAGYESAESYREMKMEDAWDEGYRQAMAYEGAAPDPEELASNPYRDEDRDPAEIDKLRAIVERVKRLAGEWPEDSQRRVQAKKQWIAAEALRAALTDDEDTHGLRKMSDDYVPVEGSDG